MTGFAFASKVLATVTFCASLVAAADLDPIVIKGAKFFYKTSGEQFFIKGIAYQQDFSSNGTISGDLKYKDPLADVEGCKRDVPLLKDLATNTIRVYAVDPTANHDECMQLLQDAGIYVVADLGEPATSINRDTPEWNTELYKRYIDVVDNLQKYTNTLGFFAGNEVSNAPNNTVASAFVKAAVRDTKAYILQKKYRAIGVGYATNDDETREELANYFNCGPVEDAIDFWGYNIYSWCQKSTFEKSHYDVRTREFASYSVPAFFAEYGCRVPPRLFDDVDALFGKQMTPVWSGGIVYMYFQEANDYGLVSVGSDDKATKLPDYTVYSSHINEVKPTGVESSSYSPSNKPQACPKDDSHGEWQANSTLPPSPNSQLCSCMVQNLTCVAVTDLKDETVQDNFDYLCDPHTGSYCGGITANGTTGIYGSYSMCSSIERLSWSFNQLYLNETANNPDNTNPCDFKGAGKKQTPKLPDSCKALVSEAGGLAGTGTVTSAPTGTGASGGSATTSGAAGSVTIPKFDFGILHLAVYLTVAALVGGGMILL